MATIGIDASRAISTAPTGTEAYSAHLIRAMAAEGANAHVMRLYLRETPSAALQDILDANDHVAARVIPLPRLWTHVRLSWEMLRHPPSLLFVPAHVLPLHHPRRALVTVHDLGFLAFPEAHPAGQRRYLAWSTHWNVRQASHILADSFATRDAVTTTYRVPPERITVAYPGYGSDIAPVRGSRLLHQVRERYKIPGDYILFIGSIQPRKNLTRLIEAFGHIASDREDVSLVLAGPAGWLAEPIKAQVAASGLKTRVLFPGYIAEEDKAALISGARLFAYPSLYEGFGFPVLEAQACGTPLLTSTTSSLPEVTGDGGWLVDPEDVAAIADGLSRLLDDEALRSRLVAAGFQNLARFSWERTARQVWDVIERQMGGCVSGG